jgi:hypothetical protein
MTKRHLLDYPSPTTLNDPFAASGINWNNFLMGSIGVAAVRYARHADAWLSILSTWEREQFSIMRRGAAGAGAVGGVGRQ